MSADSAAANTNAAAPVDPDVRPDRARITPANLPDLVADLKKCHAEALASVVGTGDGGTCNFDSPVLACEKRDAKLVEAAVKIAGGSCFEWKLWRKFAGMVLSFGRPGQGNRNTRYADAFGKALKARGWPTSMYYQMD
jgi:hypothetical protein